MGGCHRLPAYVRIQPATTHFVAAHAAPQGEDHSATLMLRCLATQGLEACAASYRLALGRDEFTHVEGLRFTALLTPDNRGAQVFDSKKLHGIC